VSNNPLYAPLDVTKLPLASLYGTMKLLKDLHPGGLDGDVPMWNLKTWRETQRRSKLPAADCANCEHDWKGENRARWEHRYVEAREIDSWHCFMLRDWPGPKCALFQRNGGPR